MTAASDNKVLPVFTRLCVTVLLLGLFTPLYSFASSNSFANSSLALSRGGESAVGLDGVTNFIINNPVLVNPDPSATPQQQLRASIFIVIGHVLNVATILAVAAIMFGGFLYITSLGDESRARRGKVTVAYTSIGLMVIGLSVLLTNIFVNAVNEARNNTYYPRHFILILLMRFLVPLSIIAFGAVAYGGFLYITSAGSEDRARRGKMVLLYSGIGLALIMLSVIIVNAILGFNV